MDTGRPANLRSARAPGRAGGRGRDVGTAFPARPRPAPGQPDRPLRHRRHCRAQRPALLALVCLALAAPPADARRRAVLTPVAGGETPASAVAGTAGDLYAAHADAIWRYGAPADNGSPPPRQDTEPVARGRHGAIAQLVADGARLVAVDVAGWISLFDVSRRGAPARYLGALSSGSAAPRDVVVDGDRLVVVDAAGVLRIAGITPDGTPVEVGRLAASLALYHVAVDGPWIFATAYASPKQIYCPGGVVLLAIDVADAARPREVGMVEVSMGSGYSYAYPRGLRRVGRHVVVFSDWQLSMGPWGGFASAGRIDVVDAADPARMRRVEGVGDWIGHAGWSDVSRTPAGSGRVLLAGGREVRVVDLADPLRPVIGAPAALLDVAAADIAFASPDGRPFVLDAWGKLYGLDFTGPTEVRVVAAAPTSRRATGVAVAGDRAYVAYDGAGLDVLDVVDAAAPRRLGSAALPGARLAGVAVAGTTAYVAAGDAGVAVVDVADDAAPVVRARVDTPGDAARVAVDGPRLYVAEGDAGLSVIDIADPAAPRLMATVALPGRALDVVSAGGRAYVAGGFDGLWAVDASDPTAPAVETIAGTGQTTALAVDGARLYAATFYGLTVADAADPGTFLGHADSDVVGCCLGWPTAVAARGGFAFVVGEDAALHVLDARDPAHIAGAGRAPLPAPARGIALAGDHALAANWQWGLRAVRAAVGDAVRAVYLPAVSNRAVDAELVQLTHAGEQSGMSGAAQPALSPDGTRMVAVWDTPVPYEPRAGLWLLNRTTGNQVAIDLRPDLRQVETPTFTPDGTALIFAALHTRWDVVRYDLATRRLDNLTGGRFGPRSQHRRPSLSRDGRWLAFDRVDPDAPGGLAAAEDVFVLDLASGDVRRLTDDPAVDRFPSFAPDGARLAFRSARDGQSELYAVGIDGTGLTRLTAHPAHDGYPTFSPDGRWIAFQSDRGGRDDVFVLNVATREVWPASDGARVLREPRFAPDGRHLVVSAPLAYVSPTYYTFAEVFELALPRGIR